MIILIAKKEVIAYFGPNDVSDAKLFRIAMQTIESEHLEGISWIYRIDEKLWNSMIR